MSSARGVSLIELLIVIAVIGIIAAIILAMIDPIEQFARGRDASRKYAITQIGHAMQGYFVGNIGKTYPVVSPSGPNWMQQLISDGELKNEITAPDYGDGSTQNCNTNKLNGMCYETSSAPLHALVWARLESKIENSKCKNDPSTPLAYWVFATLNGGAGVVCFPEDPNYIPNPVPTFR